MQIFIYKASRQSAELIGQALFTPLALRSEGLASVTLARCANVSSAFMPTAPARLLASLQVLHCFACSTSAADTHRLARPHTQIAYPPHPSFRKVLISSALLKGNRSSPLHSAKATFRRLGFSHLGTLANVTSASMPTAPARLLASLPVLHCFACSTSAADTHRLARPHAQMACAPRHSFRKSLWPSHF